MVKKYFRRIRTFYWYLRSYFLRYTWIILLSFIVGIVFFKIFFPVLKKILSPKPQLSIGLIGTFTENDLPKEVQNLISLGLTSISASGSASPALASQWKITDEGRVYLFTLKKGVFWQDGTLFKAKDINYNFKDVKGEAIDETHYKFILKEPFSPFLSLLSQPLFKKRLLGLGGYKVTQIEKSGSFLKTMKLESTNQILEYKFFPNQKSAITAFKLGEIDILKQIADSKEFKNWKNIKILPELKLDTIVALFFNTRSKKLNEKSFRQALTYAIVNKQIKEVKAYGPISPVSWAYNDNLKEYNYDLNEANRLLSKTDESSASAKIILTAVRPYNKYLSEIATAWRNLGLEVQERVENIVPYKFEVLLAGQEIFTDPDQYVYWHSRSEGNLTGYTSPKIDKFLEDGRQISDFTERKQRYADFQKYLVEDAPAVFLYFPTVFNITKVK